ncbi:hypothetical protein AVEN_232778-1 [Araneus ventricosus]|uniref:Transposase Tc1-like domain-containing protein n=1 Tax=Araneus ventricosus TaxID=182803 RepID=A0A4Y2QSH9_ARAVE|nr:hypothetical protein AVEN_232778-1 [Araneus ventricosus]
MPLRRRRSHYQQLTEFERGRVVGLREGGLFSAILQKDLAGIYPLCMIVGRSGQGKVLPQEDRVPGGTTEREDRRVRLMAVEHRTASAAEIRAAVGTTVTQRTVTNRLFQGQLRVRRPVGIPCIPLTPNH